MEISHEPVSTPSIRPPSLPTVHAPVSATLTAPLPAGPGSARRSHPPGRRGERRAGLGGAGARPLGGSGGVDNETVVVATTKGMFRSTNGGRNFSPVMVPGLVAGMPGMLGFFTDLVSNGSGSLFAATRDSSTSVPMGGPDSRD